MKIRSFIASALLLVGLTSCEHSRLVFNGDPDTQYHKTLRMQTQYQKLFALDEVLYQTYVTYMSAELSEQYIDEYAKIFSLSDAEKIKMHEDDRADHQKYDDFMVAHYASASDNQALNKNLPDQIVWKFFLESDGNELAQPIEITPIKLGTQKNYFYPHLNGWNKLFRIRFAKNSSTTKKLLMKGPVRELTFMWKNQ